jgi:hypothetical protein
MSGKFQGRWLYAEIWTDRPANTHPSFAHKSQINYFPLDHAQIESVFFTQKSSKLLKLTDSLESIVVILLFTNIYSGLSF